MVYVLADPALPDLLRRRLRDGPLPVSHAPTASGWSNSSRVGFFLLLDQDALSRRTVPFIYYGDEIGKRLDGETQ